MKTHIFIFFSLLLLQNANSQCKLVIVQRGAKSELMNELKILNYQDVPPTRINDSTLEFTYYPTEPKYLYILLDPKKHGDSNINFNWKSRIWIAPEIKRRKLIINYSNKTIEIPNINVENKTLHEWDSICQLMGEKNKDSEEIYIVTSYIKTHPDSYLSLWFFTHSHMLYLESTDKKLALFNQLNPALDLYPEYHQIKADLSGARKYPNAGDAFKEFTLTDVKGRKFNSAAIKNKWILLHFWSNGCGPCVHEMDSIVSYYKTLDTSKIAFISLALDNSRANWQKAATTRKIIWTNLWESDGFYGDLCLNYNIPAMPFFVLFNSEKKLVVMQDGSDAMDVTIKSYLSKVK